ncbi:hypothetical protein CSPX01_11597 [Colletotrichum filicis]|nr:hypothetical protein CSPX01_11597 [Colletotrichum filicis]
MGTWHPRNRLAGSTRWASVSRGAEGILRGRQAARYKAPATCQHAWEVWEEAWKTADVRWVKRGCPHEVIYLFGDLSFQRYCRPRPLQVSVGMH